MVKEDKMKKVLKIMLHQLVKWPPYRALKIWTISSSLIRPVSRIVSENTKESQGPGNQVSENPYNEFSANYSRYKFLESLRIYDSII